MTACNNGKSQTTGLTLKSLQYLIKKILSANYQAFSLLSQMYKLLTKMITKKLTNNLDDYQPVVQASFRNCFSTFDHVDY